MQLSRTARFLIAALLLAAAAFVWVNFFNQNGLEGAPTVVDTQAPGGAINVGGAAGSQNGVPAPGQAGPGAAGAPAAVDGQPMAGAGQAAPAGAAASDASGAAPSQADGAAPSEASEAQAVSPEAGAPPVVVAGSDQVVTRDLVVEQLPFLVLGPPATADGEAGGADAEGASRPQASQRASINPFSPVVVRAPPAAAPPQVVAQAEEPEVPASPQIVEVQSDGQPPAASAQAAAPQAPPEPVRAPAPRTVAPAGVVASNLPRALPSGTLPATPQILRDARSAPVVVEPVAPDIGDLAALREPEPEAAEVAPVDAAIAPSAAAVVPDPLGPGRPLSQPVQAARPDNALPLAVGADPLSRYLRDNDVRFTGTVLGPLSVGVFRSNQFSAPVILTLGQALPDTDIILSDLRGYEARFTQGDRTQTLSLDLRR